MINTTPWFNTDLPPMQRLLRVKLGGKLETMPIRVIEADGKLLIFTVDAVYEEKLTKRHQASTAPMNPNRKHGN